MVDWLLESDPSVKFQTKRDILEMTEEQWKKDQLEMEHSGWVKHLLSHQNKSGTWGNGLYSPKFTSTHYTLILLRRLGMYQTPVIAKGCDQLIKIDAIGQISESGKHRLDACITGMGLSILAHFEMHTSLYDEIIQYIKENQLEDGGWNCRYGRYPNQQITHASVHTTLSVLEGLRELTDHFPKYKSTVENLRVLAHNFLLRHELYKSHTTGDTIHKDMLELAFPPRWKYNILSAMDYFRSIEHPFDKRMEDAIEIIRNKGRDGKWYKGKQMSGKKFFSLNKPRSFSPFNTLRATRVLVYYDDYDSHQ